jgi:hypothetical protein
MSSYPAPNPSPPPLGIYNEQNWYSKSDPTGPVGPQGVQGGLGPPGVAGSQGFQGWQGISTPTTTTLYTQTFASPTTTFNIDTNGGLQKVVLTASTAFALTISTNRPFVLLVEQGGIGSYLVTWFTTINWAGGTPPTLTTAVGKTDAFGFIRTSSGNYLGYVVGLNA